MKKKSLKIITGVAAFIAALIFLAVFGRAQILKAYIRTGIGNCEQIPILCKTPVKEVVNPALDKAYAARMIPYVFKDLAVSLPKGFTVVKGEYSRAYYKKWRKFDRGSVVYLLRKNPDFFVGLFPRFCGEKIKHDYDFIARVMYAQTESITGLTDAFFVIMKSIFTPDLGEQKNVVMIKFLAQANCGFINFNLGPKDNYFDCNIIDNHGNFFKVYIKDKGARLDLEKVFTIIATINKP